jgi:hypothetical protein
VFAFELEGLGARSSSAACQDPPPRRAPAVTGGPFRRPRPPWRCRRQPRGRGADGEGQLHRHLRADARHPALRRAVPARPAARRPPDERQARARGDQRGLRPPARRQGGPPGDRTATG